MKKNVTVKRIIATILAVMMISALLPASVFAATTKTKYKRTKTIKEYNEQNELIYSIENKSFNKRGNVTKRVTQSMSYDYTTRTSKLETTTMSGKYSYYSNGVLKKSTYSYSSGRKSVNEYNSTGGLKKTTSTYKSNGKTVKEVTTYKLNSKGIEKSSVTKRNGIVSRKATYDSKGNIKKSESYDSTGKKVIDTSTYSYKYNKKGFILSETEKNSDGSTFVRNYTYDKKGNQSSWGYTNTYVDLNGQTYSDSYLETYQYTFNKDGSVKERRAYDKDNKLVGRTVYTYTSKKY